MSADDVIRDAFARIIWIRGELDPIARDLALEDLESDLARVLGEDKRSCRCVCGLAFRWPGELDHHEQVSGHRFEAAA